jgi:hypothetical protein
MLSDEVLDRLSVMNDLTNTMVEACKMGLVARDVAEKHVTMYSMEIAGLLSPQEISKGDTEVGIVQQDS